MFTRPWIHSTYPKLFSLLCILRGYSATVRLLAGKASYECKYSTEHQTVIVYNKNFVKFPCGNINGAKNSEGFMVSAIQINSIVPRQVNLTTLRTNGLLDWIVVTEGTNDSGTVHPSLFICYIIV